MRLPGYCTECRRARRINASGHALAMAGARRSGVVTGVCDECERDKDFRQGVRVRHRNTGKVGVCRDRAAYGNVLVLWDDVPEARGVNPIRSRTDLLTALRS